MQLIPIEKVFSNRDSVRKAREAFLISKGRTLLPHGLNIREEPYSKSLFPFVLIYIFLLLLYLYFNILLLLSYFLYLLYTVNQFSFTHFRYCVSTFSYKHMPQCKFSLYLKKAGLASRNIVHFLKKVILRCIGLCFHYHHLYLLSRLDQPLIQRILQDYRPRLLAWTLLILIGPFLFKTMTTIEDKNIPSRRGQHLIGNKLKFIHYNLWLR